MPKYVVSSTLERADWQNTTILSGDPAQSVAALKDEVDGVILVAGSATLVKSLIENDLVDEYALHVYPLVLGSGRAGKAGGEHGDEEDKGRATDHGDGR